MTRKSRNLDLEEGPANTPRLPPPSKYDDFIPALAWRRYHLPGYDYCEDLLQYLGNNHPLFGLCCHHKLHPIQWRMRLFMLLGSIVCGLLITNAIWLYYAWNDDVDIDGAFISIDLHNNTGIDPVDGSTANDGTITITNGMILLWTAGAALHGLFDNLVWYATACVCCLPSNADMSEREENDTKPSRCRGFGNYTALILITIATAAATLIVLVRASHDSNPDPDVDATTTHDRSNLKDWQNFSFEDDKSAYRFLASYAVELVLALLLYYPLMAIVFFSGVLGCCGAVPILGGRPYEVRMEWQRWERAQRRRQWGRSRTFSPAESSQSR